MDSRAKGVKGEHEVKVLLERHGFAVRGLEGQGDHLAIGHGLTLHCETKRRERFNVWVGLAQAETEAPPDVPALLFFRRNRTGWKVAGDADVLLGLMTR